LLEPLANSLDKLRGEKYSTHINSIKKANNPINQFKALQTTMFVINKFLRKKKYVFHLSDPESNTYIITSISHPVGYTNLCKNIFF